MFLDSVFDKWYIIELVYKLNQSCKLSALFKICYNFLKVTLFFSRKYQLKKKFRRNNNRIEKSTRNSNGTVALKKILQEMYDGKVSNQIVQLHYRKGMMIPMKKTGTITQEVGLIYKIFFQILHA